MFPDRPDSSPNQPKTHTHKTPEMLEREIKANLKRIKDSDEKHSELRSTLTDQIGYAGGFFEKALNNLVRSTPPPGAAKPSQAIRDIYESLEKRIKPIIRHSIQKGEVVSGEGEVQKEVDAAIKSLNELKEVNEEEVKKAKAELEKIKDKQLYADDMARAVRNYEAQISRRASDRLAAELGGQWRKKLWIKVGDEAIEGEKREQKGQVHVEAGANLALSALDRLKEQVQEGGSFKSPDSDSIITVNNNGRIYVHGNKARLEELSQKGQRYGAEAVKLKSQGYDELFKFARMTSKNQPPRGTVDFDIRTSSEPDEKQAHLRYLVTEMKLALDSAKRNNFIVKFKDEDIIALQAASSKTIRKNTTGIPQDISVASVMAEYHAQKNPIIPEEADRSIFDQREEAKKVLAEAKLPQDKEMNAEAYTAFFAADKRMDHLQKLGDHLSNVITHGDATNVFCQEQLTTLVTERQNILNEIETRAETLRTVPADETEAQKIERMAKLTIVEDHLTQLKEKSVSQGEELLQMQVQLAQKDPKNRKVQEQLDVVINSRKEEINKIASAYQGEADPVKLEHLAKAHTKLMEEEQRLEQIRQEMQNKAGFIERKPN